VKVNWEGCRDMANKFNNGRRAAFLAGLATESIESTDLATRSRFNFSFFDGVQEPGSCFSALTHEQLLNVIEKIKAYSRSSLLYWQNQRVGGGGLKILEVYGAFPRSSDFSHPKHVPHDVKWARFRMDNLGRLVGFVIPHEYVSKASEDRLFFYDVNTFYVVFIDLEHRFYKTETR